MKYLVLCLFLTIPLGCTTSNKLEKPESSIVSKEFSNEVRTKLLGKWCGTKKHDDGLLQQWNVERQEDGSYRVDFSTTASDGSQESWSEFGLWGVRYPIYMIQHGMGAFTGQSTKDGLVENFDSSSAWAKSLSTIAKCGNES